MNDLSTILIADDDDGHAFLIEDNLRRGGVTTPILRFIDGQDVLDFVFGRTQQPKFNPDQTYLLLLDIRMPKVDGISVLQQIKSNPQLRKMPVIILTTTDDPREVDRCHALGCNVYLHKPVSFEGFAKALEDLGRFVSRVKVPKLQPEDGSL